MAHGVDCGSGVRDNTVRNQLKESVAVVTYPYLVVGLDLLVVALLQA